MKHYQRWLVLILVLVAFAIWIDLPNNPGIHIGNYHREISTHLGLDLVGGVQALLEADLPEDQAVEAEAMNTAQSIIEDRVNGLGVSEAVVQVAGNRRILVELPGEEDPEKAIATVKEIALLEFVDLGNTSAQDVYSLPPIIKTDFAGEGQNASETVEGEEGETVYHTVMTGAELKQVGVTTDPAGDYMVAFELTKEGGQIFADYTASHVGGILAIVMDKEIISTPRINEPIPDGRGSISGNFTAESANNLAVQLRYGSLPIPLRVVQTQTIGPTLGQDSLDKSLVAGVIGMSVVLLFMAIYYRLPGIVADLALIVYTILTFAIYRWIPVTLTLPGIAGFVLSIGVAVDANVLIFERMKEELRSGHGIVQAIDLGWKRAWPSIRDSNLATLITCTILFWFGSTFGASVVKGFAVTLALGVMVSLLTAVTATRMFLHAILDNIKAIERPTWFGI
ncbi:MAG: protein translocase subunit SecD [Chloroflexota bacterium]|nr:MAG: protein translocase subunit SecD [Chloroflexota bacterium]